MPSDAVGWTSCLFLKTNFNKAYPLKALECTTENITQLKSTVTLDPRIFESSLRGGLIKLLSEALQITRYDTIAGDGDCGNTLAAGCNAILETLNKKNINLSVL